MLKETTLPPAGQALKSRAQLQEAFRLLCSMIALLCRAVFGRFGRKDAPALPAPEQPAAPPSCMYPQAFVDELQAKICKQKAMIAFFSDVFRSTSDAVIVADLGGCVLMCNDGATDLFELDREMAVGDNLFRLCTESTPDGARIAKMLVDDQSIRNMRVEIVGVCGRRTPVLLTLNFVRDDDGNQVAVVAVIKDNSESERQKAALEFQKAELEKLTITDQLTGLYNRRHFDKEFGDEYERMKRGHHDAASISLVVADIDHFKNFNDGYGHDVGDKALKMVADAVKRTVRKIDIPCRFGGEEIVVILPGTSERGALALSERIRQAVAEIRVPVNGKSLSVTVSIGVSTHSADDVNKTVGQLIHEADMAMYQAKNTGRNRVVTYESMVA